MKDLKRWCASNKLDAHYCNNIVTIGGLKFFFLEEFEFESDFSIDPTDIPIKEVDYVLYKFGTQYYYTPVTDLNKPKLISFKYIGTAKSDLEVSMPFLGVHGKYELMNGSRDYSLWCKKAKFLSVNTLGICEKNTLAGALCFQNHCKDNEIKSILGETFDVKTSNDQTYQVKLYAINETGWRNLLTLNYLVNTENTSFVEEDKIFQHSEGLICVIVPLYSNYDHIDFSKYITVFTDNLFYQFDTVELNNDTSDQQHLLNLNKFLNSSLRGVLINDAYYLDKEDYRAKTILNSIKKAKELSSDNQYFKQIDEIFSEFDELFTDSTDLFFEMYENLNEICEKCNYSIPTGTFHLPEYILTPEEKKKYGDKMSLFYALLEQGIEEKLQHVPDIDVYLERISMECEILEMGNYIDYFLILRDIISWCRQNNILIGFGRGSAAGVLCGYLLDITRVDPIEYGLLFERFTNEGRVKVSSPDIDTDIESLRRNEVKAYVEQRYGTNRVCSIGTYTTFQLKQAITDISSLNNIPIGEVREFTKSLDIEQNAGWEELFKEAIQKPKVMSFIQRHSNVIEDVLLIKDQPKAAATHACATLILPFSNEIVDTLPVRKDYKENMIVSEWEGQYIESAGFLKEDLLGINQLDKFQFIKNGIKEYYNENIDIYNIPLDDPKVFELFSKGYNGDVFHFGAKGLTKYSVVMKPSNIRELIAMIALFRPGPIENGFHMKYINIKNGIEDPIYYTGTEEITKETYSVICYQEQIMEICRQIGGFSLTQADDIRKAMGKKKKKVLDEYKEKFIENAISLSSYSKEEADELWDAMEKFAGYAFNKSHATCYAVTGYISQWLKVHYPLIYWMSALTFTTDKKISDFLSEIYNSKLIKLKAININKSNLDFHADFQDNTLLWSISKIKQCGPVAVQAIFDERNKNGEFFSFEEFIERTAGGRVNKSVIENLVIAGAFDELENIKFPTQRKLLIEKYREIHKTKIDPEKDWYTKAIENKKIYNDWWWQQQQKKVSGFAIFDYFELLSTNIDRFNEKEYFDVDYLLKVDTQDQNTDTYIVSTGGVVSEYTIKESKKGVWMKIKLEQNYSFITLTLWADDVKKFDITEEVLADNPIMLFRGRLTYDTFLKENALCSDPKSFVKFLK